MPSLKLKNSTWKWDGWNTIVPFWDSVYFQGRTVSFRELVLTCRCVFFVFQFVGASSCPINVPMKESSWLYSTYIMYVPRNKALRSGLLTHGFLGGGFKYFLFLPLPYLEKWSDLTYFANGLKPPQVSLKKGLIKIYENPYLFRFGGHAPKKPKEVVEEDFRLKVFMPGLLDKEFLGRWTTTTSE